MFYHIKNLQSTKTQKGTIILAYRFITLRIYKVLKHQRKKVKFQCSFITLRIYKVLKR